MTIIKQKDYYTIGQVVDKLKTRFNDVTISKIRFLEDEGLIKPERTASGYRKFSEGDLERLKSILSLQKEQYLPLSVIKRNISLVNKGIKKQKLRLTKQKDGFRAKELKKYSLSDAAKKHRLSRKQIQELINYAIIKTDDNGGKKVLSELDLKILDIFKSLAKFGIEARHLKMFDNMSEKEAMLIFQIAAPLIKNKKRFEDKVTDISNSFQGLRKLLLERSLHEALDEKSL